MTLKIGSLFAGYGGLDLAIEAATGAQPAWFVEFDDAPSRILAHHWENVPNLGDVTKVDWEKVPPVDIIAGGSPCFTANVPVLTHRGLVPISEVVVGDLVLTHKRRWRRVTATMTRKAEVVEFQPGLFATSDHRFFAREEAKVWDNDKRRYVRKLGKPEWAPISECAGRFLATPTSIPVSEKTTVPHLPDGWTWWHIGRWVADGWGGVEHAPVIAVGSPKIDRDKCRFDEDFWRFHQERTALKVTYRSKLGVDFLDDFGHGEKNKTLPAWLLSADENIRREFLDGYWSGDGAPQGVNGVKSVSVSPALTAGIQLLASTLGYTTWTAYVHPSNTKIIEGRIVSQSPWWQVVSTPDDGRYTVAEDGFRWWKLRRPAPHGGVQTVYDLTVDEDHSFIAAGIVVHNCQDLSSAGRRAGMTEGTRSNLWVNMRESIAVIRPKLVVWENVLGALSASAFSESDVVEAGVSGGNLRALGRVLGDLSDLGYDAQWTVLRASDVGSCHHRARVFVVAYPAGTDAGSLRGLLEGEVVSREGEAIG